MTRLKWPTKPTRDWRTAGRRRGSPTGQHRTQEGSNRRLLAAFENKVVAPALEKLAEVRRRKAVPPLRRSAED